MPRPPPLPAALEDHPPARRPAPGPLPALPLPDRARSPPRSPLLRRAAALDEGGPGLATVGLVPGGPNPANTQSRRLLRRLRGRDEWPGEGGHLGHVGGVPLVPPADAGSAQSRRRN